MIRPLPECERFLALASASGSEVIYSAKTQDGEVVSCNMTAVIAEMVQTIRALEKLIEARHITDRGGMGGLGPPPQA